MTPEQRAQALQVPLVDFSRFESQDGSDRLNTARAVLAAFQDVGFVYLSNHGIPPAVVENIFAQSASFFSKSQEQKDRLAWKSARANRGYEALGKEKVSNSSDIAGVAEARLVEGLDLKETFQIGREDEPGHANQWPDEEGGVAFKHTLLDFFDRCKDLHLQVMSAIATGMDLDPRWFDGYCSHGDNSLRLLHYPPVERRLFQENRNRVRAGAHSDYGSITLLFQDDRGGLQIRSPRGEFVDVVPLQGTIVVNAGDLLARWSNDMIKSTEHRVVEPCRPDDSGAHPARYSIAYFCHPDFDKVIEALPGTVDEGRGRPRKYGPVNSLDYLRKRLEDTH